MTTPSDNQTGQPKRSTTLIVTVIGVSLLAILILGSFVGFFVVNATAWTPAPTYTATFNSTQAKQATDAIGSLTPKPTSTPAPTKGVTATAAATVTTAANIELTPQSTNAGVTATPSNTPAATFTATASPEPTK